MNEDVKSENVRIHSRADELIACLEGEIAKRDETIARLEPQLNRAIQANYDLREELAACRVAVENCELFRARIAELESRYQRDVWGLNNEGDPIGGEPAGGYANDNARLRAELTALKAQGVVMPERWNVPRPMWKDARQPYGNPLNHADIEAAEKFNLALDEVSRLNAAPVQQVSAPDGWRELAKRADDFLYSLPETDGVLRLRADLCSMLAAPAAPAADAGLVEALETIINPIEAMRRELQVGEQLNGMVAMQLASDPEYLRGVAKAALATHCAKGVV